MLHFTFESAVLDSANIIIDSINKMHTTTSILDALKIIYRILRGAFSTLMRSLTGVDRHIIKTYFMQHNVHGLHIGCGKNPIPNFLNADISPVSDVVLRLDATRPFPFESGSFDYIFSEHMIEHISYDEGLHMLRECYRVLKKGGIIRISTPDLAHIAALTREGLTELESRYVEWSIGQFLPKASGNDPAFVVNNFFRDWGHQFIYTYRTLAASLEQCSFTDIEPCQLNESRAQKLKGLENESRMPEGFLVFETLTVEATKPG